MEVYEILLQGGDSETMYGYVKFRSPAKNFYDALAIAERKIIVLRMKRDIKYEIVKIEMLQ
jgi:hypothetical protein